MTTKNQPDHRGWPGIAAGSCLFAWYLFTGPPGLMFFDSGEFALVGAQFGLGHPPGQPLYTLVLGTLSAAWPGDPLTIMNLFSAACMAGCALPINGLMLQAGQGDGRIRFVVLLLFGLSFPIWDQAARIELYSFSTLLVLASINYAVKPMEEDADSGSLWFTLGIMVGLIGAINPIHAIALAGAVGLFSVPSLLRAGWTSLLKASSIAFGGALIGSLPQTYLWWASQQKKRFVWGSFETTDQWVSYLVGADYAHTDHSAWLNILTNLGEWLRWTTTHGLGPALVVGSLGLMINSWTRRRIWLWACPLVIGAIFSFSYGRFYSQVPDFSAYLCPFIWLTSIGISSLLTVRDGQVERKGLGVLAGISLAVLLFGTHIDRSGNDLSRQISTRWLESLPRNSILLLESDHLVFPVMYLQAIEKIRPDVLMLNVGFGSSAWYWTSLFDQSTDVKPIPIRAGPLGGRLKTFLAANQHRPHYAEHAGLARLTGQRACLATWGVALQRDCSTVIDDGSAFEKSLEAWWTTQVNGDPISGRVLSAIGEQRGRNAMATGAVEAAMEALIAGVPPGARPELPEGALHWVQLPTGFRLPRTLIGHPTRNLTFGQGLLLAQPGGVSEKILKSWQQAMEHPLNLWE